VKRLKHSTSLNGRRQAVIYTYTPLDPAENLGPEVELIQVGLNGESVSSLQRERIITEILEAHSGEGNA